MNVKLTTLETDDQIMKEIILWKCYPRNNETAEILLDLWLINNTTKQGFNLI